MLILPQNSNLRCLEHTPVIRRQRITKWLKSSKSHGIIPVRDLRPIGEFTKPPVLAERRHGLRIAVYLGEWEVECLVWRVDIGVEGRELT